MRRALLTLLLFATPALAQQSMFNVPSGTGTTRGGFFFQQQANLSALGESNLTASVGVGGGVELGLNLFHVDLYGAASAQSARNMLMANAVFTADVSDWLTLQAGGQFGIGRDVHEGREVPVSFGYGVARIHPEQLRLAAVVGMWAASETYVGHGVPAGALLGLEFEVVHEWLVLQADLLMGNTEASVGVIGAVLLLPLGWQLALGLQVPSPFSSNSFGGVLEITHVPPGAGEHQEPVRWQKSRVSPKWLREHREKHGIEELPEPPGADD
jgi:hypothetical protein